MRISFPYFKLIIIVLPVIVVKSLLYGFSYFYNIVIIRSKPLAEVAVEVAKIWTVVNITSILLFIVYLLLLYFLYKSQDLKRMYRGMIIALLGILIIGFILGWVLGGLIASLYFKESFNILNSISYGLASSIYDILLYLFGGFAIIALSYLIHNK